MVGSSIFILALEAALAAKTNVVPARAQPYQIQRLAGAFDPARVAVIYERDRLGPRLLRQLEDAGYALVRLDAATGVGTCNDGRQSAITCIEDLLNLLKFCQVEMSADHLNREM